MLTRDNRMYVHVSHMYVFVCACTCAHQFVCLGYFFAVNDDFTETK